MTRIRQRKHQLNCEVLESRQLLSSFSVVNESSGKVLSAEIVNESSGKVLSDPMASDTIGTQVIQTRPSAK